MLILYTVLLVLSPVVYAGINLNDNRVNDRQLMSATCLGDIDKVQAWLDKGGDANLKDKYGNTPLMLSAENGHTEITKLLLKNKANYKLANEQGYTALHNAVANEHIEDVLVLLEAGADLNAPNIFNTSPANLIQGKGLKNKDEFIKYVYALHNKYIQGPYCLLYTKPWQRNYIKYLKLNDLASAYSILEKQDTEPEAQMILAKEAYKRGNVKAAKTFAIKAANRGLPEAKLMVGQILLQEDNYTGIAYICEAADNGIEKAAVECGKAYYTGKGVDQDYSKAYGYIMSSISLDDPDAYYYIGLMRYYGQGIPQNKLKGISDIKKAINRGSKAAYSEIIKINTEEFLSYIKQIKKINRTTFKTYALSQGAIFVNEDGFCDEYNVSTLFHSDFSTHSIVACFPKLKSSYVKVKLKKTPTPFSLKFYGEMAKNNSITLEN